MNIYGSQFVQGAHSVPAPHSTGAARQKSTVAQMPMTQPQDEVKLSTKAQQLANTESATSSGEIRYDLVNRIRTEIAAGTYETEDKLNTALDKMIAAVGY